MGHSICAFVAAHQAMTALSAALDGAPFYRLAHPQLLVMPVTDQVFDRVVELKGISDPIADGFWGLTKHLAAFAAKHSVHGSIAYVETDYFGGTGTQCAAAWLDGHTVMAPQLSQSTGPINQALAAIGLAAAPGRDAFDTLGLGQVRHIDDFANRTPT